MSIETSPTAFIPATLVRGDSHTPVRVPAHACELPIQEDDWTLSPDDDGGENVNARRALPPALFDRLMLHAPVRKVGEPVTGDAHKRSMQHWRKTFGRFPTSPQHPLVSRCQKRRDVIVMVQLGCALALPSADVVKLVCESMTDPTEPQWVRTIDADVRASGLFPEWGSLSRELEAQEESKNSAGDAAKQVEEAKKAARLARDSRINDESLRDLGVDACLKVRVSDMNGGGIGGTLTEAQRLFSGTGIDVAAAPRIDDCIYILVQNDGRALDVDQRICAGVRALSLDTVLEVQVGTLKRFRLPDLMLALRNERQNNAPMTEADFFDSESIEGRMNLERGIEDGEPLLLRAVATFDDVYGSGRRFAFDLLDRLVCGRRIDPAVAVDAIHAIGVEAWRESIRPKPRGWDEEQRARLREKGQELVTPPVWEEVHPLPKNWTKAALMKLTHSLVDGSRRLSSPGEFVERATDSFVDRAVRGLRTDPWRAPVQTFVNDVNAVTTAAIVTFLRGSDLLEGEMLPAKHARLVAIMKDAGFKKTTTTLEGRQQKAFKRVSPQQST